MEVTDRAKGTASPGGRMDRRMSVVERREGREGESVKPEDVARSRVA